MKQATKGSERGYSVVEMMIVLVITVAMAGVAIPTTANTIANIKLRGAASDFAGLVQQARLAAVQKNGTYNLCFGLTSGQGAYAEQQVATDTSLDCNGYASGDPIVQFGGQADHASAPSGANPTKLDGPGSTLGWTGTSGNLSFNSRGLPCSYSSGTCSTNLNYVFYFSDTRQFSSHGWAAVSITSTGRSKVWFWAGSKWVD